MLKKATCAHLAFLSKSIDAELPGTDGPASERAKALPCAIARVSII
jgi:hypothetical protein